VNAGATKPPGRNVLQRGLEKREASNTEPINISSYYESSKEISARVLIIKTEGV